jgi:signal transduction histidine kinase
MEFITPLAGCPDPDALIASLQGSAEKARAALSRELHDQMGGLLVAAAMDIGFVEQALATDDRLKQQLTRAHSALSEAIELKRRLIESLRPSILDNFGLFEAIRWEAKRQSGFAGLPYSESYPSAEPEFNRDAAIILFRIVQESLAVALRQPSVRSAGLALSIGGDQMGICVSHDSDAQSRAPASEDVVAICLIGHRAHQLGGRLTVTPLDGGGAKYVAILPMASLV